MVIQICIRLQVSICTFWHFRIVCTTFFRYHKFYVLKSIKTIVIRLIVLSFPMRKFLIFWCRLWFDLSLWICLVILFYIVLNELRCLIMRSLIPDFSLNLYVGMHWVLWVVITLMECYIRLCIRLTFQIIDMSCECGWLAGIARRCNILPPIRLQMWLLWVFQGHSRLFGVRHLWLRTDWHPARVCS